MDTDSDENEVFFGPVSDKEKRIAAKYKDRRTLILTGPLLIKHGSSITMDSEEDEVFFGPVCDKEKYIASKYKNRRTLVLPHNGPLKRRWSTVNIDEPKKSSDPECIADTSSSDTLNRTINPLLASCVTEPRNESNLSIRISSSDSPIFHSRLQVNKINTTESQNEEPTGNSSTIESENAFLYTHFDSSQAMKSSISDSDKYSDISVCHSETHMGNQDIDIYPTSNEYVDISDTGNNSDIPIQVCHVETSKDQDLQNASRSYQDLESQSYLDLSIRTTETTDYYGSRETSATKSPESSMNVTEAEDKVDHTETDCYGSRETSATKSPESSMNVTEAEDKVDHTETDCYESQETSVTNSTESSLNLNVTEAKDIVSDKVDQTETIDCYLSVETSGTKSTESSLYVNITEIEEVASDKVDQTETTNCDESRETSGIKSPKSPVNVTETESITSDKVDHTETTDCYGSMETSGIKSPESSMNLNISGKDELDQTKTTDSYESRETLEIKSTESSMNFNVTETEDIPVASDKVEEIELSFGNLRENEEYTNSDSDEKTQNRSTRDSENHAYKKTEQLEASEVDYVQPNSLADVIEQQIDALEVNDFQSNSLLDVIQQQIEALEVDDSAQRGYMEPEKPMDTEVEKILPNSRPDVDDNYVEVPDTDFIEPQQQIDTLDDCIQPNSHLDVIEQGIEISDNCAQPNCLTEPERLEASEIGDCIEPNAPLETEDIEQVQNTSEIDCLQLESFTETDYLDSEQLVEAYNNCLQANTILETDCLAPDELTANNLIPEILVSPCTGKSEEELPQCINKNSVAPYSRDSLSISDKTTFESSEGMSSQSYGSGDKGMIISDIDSHTSSRHNPSLLGTSQFCDEYENRESLVQNNLSLDSPCSVDDYKDHSGVSSSPKFNDTLEEMEMLLKYGMNYVEGKEASKNKIEEPLEKSYQDYEIQDDSTNFKSNEELDRIYEEDYEIQGNEDGRMFEKPSDKSETDNMTDDPIISPRKSSVESIASTFHPKFESSRVSSLRGRNVYNSDLSNASIKSHNSRGDSSHESSPLVIEKTTHVEMKPDFSNTPSKSQNFSISSYLKEMKPGLSNFLTTPQSDAKRNPPPKPPRNLHGTGLFNDTGDTMKTTPLKPSNVRTSPLNKPTPTMRTTSQSKPTPHTRTSPLYKPTPNIKTTSLHKPSRSPHMRTSPQNKQNIKTTSLNKPTPNTRPTIKPASNRTTPLNKLTPNIYAKAEKTSPRSLAKTSHGRVGRGMTNESQGPKLHTPRQSPSCQPVVGGSGPAYYKALAFKNKLNPSPATGITPASSQAKKKLYTPGSRPNTAKADIGTKSRIGLPPKPVPSRKLYTEIKPPSAVPGQRSRSPVNIPGLSNIQKQTFKPGMNNIVSPIARYLKNNPPPPLIRTVRSQSSVNPMKHLPEHLHKKSPEKFNYPSLKSYLEKKEDSDNAEASFDDLSSKLGPIKVVKAEENGKPKAHVLPFMVSSSALPVIVGEEDKENKRLRHRGLILGEEEPVILKHTGRVVLPKGMVYSAKSPAKSPIKSPAKMLPPSGPMPPPGSRTKERESLVEISICEPCKNE